jgi:hypothetical protein
MSGLQGLRGVVGPPRYAFQGPPYGVDTARITVSSPTSSPIYLIPQNFGTYFNITSNTMASDQLTVSFPFYNPTYSVGSTFTITDYAYTGTPSVQFTTSTPHNFRVNTFFVSSNLVNASGGYQQPYLNFSNGTRVTSITSPTTFRVLDDPNDPLIGSTFTGSFIQSASFNLEAGTGTTKSYSSWPLGASFDPQPGMKFTGPGITGFATILTVTRGGSTSGTFTVSPSFTSTASSYSLATPEGSEPILAVETTNEAYPTPEQDGSFWAFKNNCSFTVFITFSNGSVEYRGTTASSMALESGNGFTILYSTANGFIIL